MNIIIGLSTIHVRIRKPYDITAELLIPLDFSTYVNLYIRYYAYVVTFVMEV